MGELTAPAFSDAEIAEAIAKHPQLGQVASDRVEGGIEVYATYDGVEISDRFVVRITKSNPHSDWLPALYEIGGRTDEIAKRLGILDRRDLHCNPDGAACVCVKQEERARFPLGARLSDFIEQLVVPYFYGLVFYGRHRKWPWGDYSHGSLGVLEFYADSTMPETYESICLIVPAIRKEKNWKDYGKLIRRPSGDRRCLCGSGRPIKACHPQVLKGVLRLGAEMDRLGIRRRSLFDLPARSNHRPAPN